MSADVELEATERWVAVASVSDVPAGWVLKVQVGSRRIALANADGTFYALDEVCSHAGGTLGDSRLKEGCYLECPWHNSIFDARTGEVVRGPARKPQSMYAVEVREDHVYVAFDP